MGVAVIARRAAFRWGHLRREKGPGGLPNAERFRGSRPEPQATPRLERCLVAVLDEGEVGRCGRKGHLSRGTPISYPGLGGPSACRRHRRPSPGSLLLVLLGG